MRPSRIRHLTPLAYCCLLTIVLLGSVERATGQIPKSDRRWIRVGSLWHYVSAYGAERAWNNSFYEGMVWPANYSLQDCFVIKRYWVAVTNFTDHNGELWPHARAAFVSSEDNRDNTAMLLKQTARFASPIVYVDGEEISEVYAGDVDEVDPDQLPDRIVTNVVRTRLGLTMTRRIMAFSQQYHDNYLIAEYVFKNTGNIDGDDEIELPGQTLTGLRFGGMLHHTTSRDAARVMGKGQITWGHDQWQSKRGETYPAYVAGDPTADSLRCAFTYLGQRNDLAYDNIGGPDKTIARDGRLAGAQHAGIAFLHVDFGPQDPADDPSQPGALGWNGNDTYPSFGATDVTTLREAYEMLSGNFPWGDTDRMDSRINSTPFPTELVDAGGAATVYGYGPWDLAFGDSIRVVEVVAISGIDRQLTESIGRTWLSGSAPYELPDGSTTSDADEFKNQWVFTGRDSLFLTFSRARRNFELGYDIPQPPQPPKTFEVISGGDRITLSWIPADGGEEAPDFGGYRLYRAVGRPDTTYEEIFATGVGTDQPALTYTFDDVTPVRGLPYYYYVASFNDGSTNRSSANPGGQLHSSRFGTQATRAAFLRRQQGSALDDIRVVPNPYYIKARALQFGTTDLRDRLMFLEIPGQCTIKIFTERGDLIETIEHTDGSGDEAWNSITSSRQVVVSGVYIAYFEVTQDILDQETGMLLYRQGEHAIRKFVIAR